MLEIDSIYKEYFEDVFKYLRGLTADEVLAEELTQETFFKAMKGIDHFRGECDIRVWLCQIAKNCFFSYCKREKKLVKQDEMGWQFAISQKSLEQILVDKELAYSLHQILHGLKEPYKEIFTLRVFGELSFRQIGDLFEKTEHWACVSFHRAKEMIQNNLGEREENHYETGM